MEVESPSSTRLSKSPPVDKFAWSKTQSSPDPSLLPMPKFLLKLQTSTVQKVPSTPVTLQMKVEVEEDESKEVEGGESAKVKLVRSAISKLLNKSPVSRNSSVPPADIEALNLNGLDKTTSLKELLNVGRQKN